MHGGHQVAQKLSSSGLPRKLSMANRVPAGVSKLSGQLAAAPSGTASGAGSGVAPKSRFSLYSSRSAARAKRLQYPPLPARGVLRRLAVVRRAGPEAVGEPLVGAGPLALPGGDVGLDRPAAGGQLTQDGHVEVYDETTTNADGVWNTLSFGPALVEDGEILDGIEDVEIDTNFGNHSVQGDQPRTAVGVIDDNHLGVRGRRWEE